MEMQCPYNNFKGCIVEKCPACNYEVEKVEIIEGRHPPDMSLQKAIERGIAWVSTKNAYRFISCKLVENNVQPVPQRKEIVNNHNSTRIAVISKKGFL